MGLLDDIRAETSAARGPKCPIALVLARLDDADRDDLTEALDPTSGATHAAIGRVLRSRGLQASDGGIATHRRGQCSCDKAA